MCVGCCVIDLVIFSNELLSPSTELIFYFCLLVDILEVAQQKLFLNGWLAKSVIALCFQQFHLVGELSYVDITRGTCTKLHH